LSPLTAQIVLALAYTGVKGNTAHELAKLLSLPDKLEDTYSTYNSLIKVFQDKVLNLTTRMFMEASSGVKEEFLKNAEKYFSSTAELSTSQETMKMLVYTLTLGWRSRPSKKS